ncbi:MAG: hypothetical protein ACRDPQ_03930 [Nocardioidaceae bacterium]
MLAGLPADLAATVLVAVHIRRLRSPPQTGHPSMRPAWVGTAGMANGVGHGDRRLDHRGNRHQLARKSGDWSQRPR